MVRSLLDILINSPSQGKYITLSCDECFIVMGYFVELILDGFKLDEIKEPLFTHLNHCLDCQDHHRKHLNDFETRWKPAVEQG